MKKENTQDKIQFQKSKSFGHVVHGCPTKDKDQDLEGKKVLQATMESHDGDDYLSEFCFMVIGEEKGEDFERAFKKLNVETFYVAKKNKKLKE